jgi:Arc/MetJ-type ribon-helix-helix transcriptional regulator
MVEGKHGADRAMICGYVLTPALRAAVRKAAHENYMSASAFVRKALDEALEKCAAPIERPPARKPGRKVSDAGMSAAA